MAWYDLLLLLLIIVSFLSGLRRGFGHSLLYSGHYIVALPLIYHSSQTLAQKIFIKFKLGSIISQAIKDGYYQPYLPADKIIIEPRFITNNWQLIQKEAGQFIAAFDFPVFVKNMFVSLLNPHSFRAALARHGGTPVDLQEALIYYVGDIFASFLAFTLAITIIYLGIFIVFRLIILLVPLNSTEKRKLFWTDRVMGSLLSGVSRIFFVCLALVLLQPALLFLAVNIHATKFLNFFWLLMSKFRPWLEEAVLNIIMGAGC